jgi:hypothetical protein
MVTYKVSPYLTGLSRIEYIPETGIAHIELSGKILPIEHHQLITVKNFDEVIHIINSTGLCELDTSDVVTHSTVRRVDFTENIIARLGSIPEYMQAVSVICNPNYNTEEYVGRGKEKGKTGVVMKGLQKTIREHLLIYDKAAETKNNVYLGVIRVEDKRCSFRSIRNGINGDNTLHDIFASDNKPVLSLFRKVLQGHTGSNIVKPTANSVTDYLYQALLRDKAGNTDLIRKELKQVCNSSATVYRHHKKILKLQAVDIAGDEYMDYIRDIETQLNEI